MTTQNLRDRAQAAAGHAPANGSTELAERPEPTIYQLVEQQRGALARALPNHLDADRLARIAVTVIKSTPGLADCTIASVLGGLMTCAQLGLEPGPLGEAYLIPFNTSEKQVVNGRDVWRKVKKAQLIIGYRGMIKLAWQSGQMASIQAYAVHQADSFSYRYGLEPTIEHTPFDGADDPGDLTHSYAVARFKDGGVASVVLNRREIEALRARSKASGDGPWVTDYEAMAKKTAIRQLSRWLPQSPQLQAFHQAAARDESLRTDWTVSLEESAPSWPAEQPAPEQQEGPADGPIKGEVVSEGPAEDLIDGDRLREVNAALSRAGYRKVGERLAFLREVTGRGDDLTATSDLTITEAAAVLEQIANPDAAGDGSGSATSDEGQEPDTPVDPEVADLTLKIAASAETQGMNVADLQALVAERYDGKALRELDLSDLSDLLDHLGTEPSS